MKGKQISEVIRKRRSVRSFLSDPIPDEDLDKILEAGLHAPSGKNRRPWRLFVVKNADTIRSIAKATTYGKFAHHAPAMLLVFAKTSENYPIEKDMLAIGACVENMMLMATAMGYGSCILGDLFQRPEIIPQEIAVDADGCLLVCGLAIGRPKGVLETTGIMECDEYLLHPANK